MSRVMSRVIAPAPKELCLQNEKDVCAFAKKIRGEALEETINVSAVKGSFKMCTSNRV